MKMLGTDEFPYPGYYRLTEGIGSDSGPIFEPTGFNEWGPPVLFCFRNRGIIPPVFRENCVSPLSVKAPAARKRYAIIYPNPSSGEIHFVAKNNKIPLVLLITDITGRTQLKTCLTTEKTVYTRQWLPGIYMAIIISEDGSRQQEKLIIGN